MELPWRDWKKDRASRNCSISSLSKFKKHFYRDSNINFDCATPRIVKPCFDMQQNQPLPKLSVGEVFY